MTLSVNPNGYGSSKGTHVSVYIHLMKGPNDDHLQFPINGLFSVQLMNWKKNTHHYQMPIEYDDGTMAPLEYRERMTTGERSAGLGRVHFISHDDLMMSSSSEGYLDEDKICFRISFEPLPQIG